MSRIGINPIAVPDGVEIKVSDDNVVSVKGKLGELTQEVKPSISVKIEDGQISLGRADEEKQTKAYHGLFRSLINNMVIGVTEGYKIQQELVGVGYRATVQGQLLDLTLGYSHHIYLELPEEVKVEAVSERGKNPVITLTSHDKQLVGQVAAKIRSLRKPEPYKGKGIKFLGEEIRKKVGKKAAE